MAIKHAFVSPRGDAPDPDNGDVHPHHWNADHTIDGILGALVDLPLSPNTLPYLKGDLTGDLAPLTVYMRSLLALADNTALMTALNALSQAGGAMTGDIAMATHRVTGLSDPASGQDAATKAYVDALATLVSGALIFKGSWDASAGTFPSTTGRKTGWFYKVSVAGTVNGIAFEVGDDLYAIVDNASASTYAANWLKIEGTISLAEVQAAIGFTFGSLAAQSSLTASQISDASANARTFMMAANYAAMRTALGISTVGNTGAYSDLSGKPTLGTAAALDVGTTANKVVQMDGTGKLPAIDGSQLTNLPSGGSIVAASISDASANGRSMLTAANYAAMLVLLGIGTAGLLDTGTTANKVVKLDGSAKLPAVDGSQLTNLPSGGVIDFRNILIANGGFEIWQRGAGGAASIAVAASTTAYTADRWYLTTAASQASTVSQQAGLSNKSRWCARVQRNSGQTGTGTMRWAFPLTTEECVRLRGATITLQSLLATGANWSPGSGTLSVNVYFGTGTEGKRNGSAFTGETNPISTSINLSTSYAATLSSWTSGGTVATNVTQGEVQFSWTPSGTAGAADWVGFDDVQLEAASSASAFEYTPFGFMLTRCQEHFWKSFAYATAPANSVSAQALAGGAISGNGSPATAHGTLSVVFPSRLRTAPTLTTFNPYANNSSARVNGSDDLSISATGSESSAYVYGGPGFLDFSSSTSKLYPVYVHMTADAGL